MIKENHDEKTSLKDLTPQELEFICNGLQLLKRETGNEQIEVLLSELTFRPQTSNPNQLSLFNF